MSGLTLIDGFSKLRINWGDFLTVKYGVDYAVKLSDCRNGAVRLQLILTVIRAAGKVVVAPLLLTAAAKEKYCYRHNKA
jgi:uncharacterized protein (AIM24 family)